MKSRIAKITRPHTQGAVERRRLFEWMDRIAGKKVIWISAPAGSGKTTLAASWLDSRNLPCLWYQAGEDDRDIASFFSYFGEAAKYAAPRFRTRLPLFTSEYRLCIAIFTRRYFEVLYSRLKPPFCFVIDNYQDVPLDAQFHEVIRHGLSVLPEGITVVVISRTDPPAPFSRLLMNGFLKIMEWEDIRFTLEESRTLVEAREYRKVTEETFASLYRKTDGWAAGLVLMAESAAKGSGFGGLADIPSDRIFSYFSDELFSRADAEMQGFLLNSAFLPRMSVADALELTGNEHADNILTDLSRHSFFTQRQAASGTFYQYHPLFREFLLKRAHEYYHPEETHRIKKKAALLLLKSGQPEEAARLMIEVSDWPGLTGLILGSARFFIASGQFLTIGTWINTIPAELVRRNGWLLYWKAMCRLSTRPAEARLFLEKAYALFLEGDDASGAFLSWAGIVDTFLYELINLRPLDRWIEAFSGLMERFGLPAPEDEERITAAIFAALMFRQPHHPDLPYWEENARKIVERSTDHSHRVFIGYNLILFYLWTGRIAEAGRLVTMLAPMIDREYVLPLPKLMWLRAEALYYFYVSRYAAGLRAVEQGLAVAEKTGVHLMDLMLYGTGIYNSAPLGDAPRAQRFLSKMASLINQDSCFAAIFYANQSSIVSLLQGDVNAALAHAKQCVRMTDEAGIPLMRNSMECILTMVLFEAKQCEQVELRGAEIRQRSSEIGSVQTEAWCSIVEAGVALDNGDESEFARHFTRTVDTCRKTGLRFLSFARSTLSRLCTKAIELNIETDYAKELIRLNMLVPDLASTVPNSWPWPLKVNTLGRFELLKNEQPLAFKGKAQQKPLALLKILIARGGEASEEDLMEILWPEADGDMAHTSFDTALHRLRKLLAGNDKILILNAGRLSLDQRFCWIDAYAFERTIKELRGKLKRENGYGSSLTPDDIEIIEADLFHLYRGNFLTNEEGNMAVIAFRERLRQDYLKAVNNLGRLHVERKAWEQAIDCFEKGLTTDKLAEEFYQGLMLCYQGMGFENSAVRTYERCCAALKKGLDLGPSTKTRGLYISVVNRRVFL